MLIADDDSTNVEVTVSCTPRAATNGTPFSTKARARFVPNEWRQLEVFFASQCIEEPLRRQREERSRAEGVEYTCGAGHIDPCIRVDRPELAVFNPSDPPPDVGLGHASTRDSGVAMDADAATDSAVDHAGRGVRAGSAGGLVLPPGVVYFSSSEITGSSIFLRHGAAPFDDPEIGDIHPKTGAFVLLDAGRFESCLRWHAFFFRMNQRDNELHMRPRRPGQEGGRAAGAVRGVRAGEQGTGFGRDSPGIREGTTRTLARLTARGRALIVTPVL